MSDKVQLGFRAQPYVAKQVEHYAEDHQISQSEALRRLVEAGLGHLHTNTQYANILEDHEERIWLLEQQLSEMRPDDQEWEIELRGDD